MKQILIVLALLLSAMPGTAIELTVNDTGTDARAIIQAALDTNSYVRLHEGTYIINANSGVPSLKLHDNNILEGSGWTTVIKLGDEVWNSSLGDYNSSLITNDCLIDGQNLACHNHDVQIRNLKVDYNAYNQTGLIGVDKGMGILVLWSPGSLIDNVWVTNANRFGIAVFPTSGSFGYPKFRADAFLNNIRIDNTATYAGLFISNGSGEPVGVIGNNILTVNNPYAGVEIEDNAGGVTLSNVQSYNNGYGILLSNTKDNQINNAWVAYNSKAGVKVSGGTWNTVLNGIEAYKNGIGLDLSNAGSTTVSNCIVRQNNDTGIILLGNLNIITGCHINSNGMVNSSPGITIYNAGINKNLISGNQIGLDPTQDQKVNPSAQSWGIYEATPMINYGNVYLNNVIVTSAWYGNNIGDVYLNPNGVKSISHNVNLLDDTLGLNHSLAPVAYTQAELLAQISPTHLPTIKVINSPYFSQVASGTILSSTWDGSNNYVFSQGTAIGINTITGEVNAGNIIIMSVS